MKNMERLIDMKKVAAGEKLDNSANEIFHTHVKQMVAALMRADTKDASGRACSIQTAWYAVGGASEPGFLSLKGLRWNELHDCGVIESFQSKPNKLKFVPFIAGPWVCHTVICVSENSTNI